MRSPPRILVNTPDIELWPADLLRARSNRDARILARARRVLRAKRDGRYLAAELADGLAPLLPEWTRQPGVPTALAALDASPPRPGTSRIPGLPPARVAERLSNLGIDAADYARRTGLALVPEPAWLAFAGRDRFRRPLWLLPGAARAWEHMQRRALADGVVLEAISGYRSHDYQLGIVARKLARGQTPQQILHVNAAPGFSEHHSGRALDIGTPGDPPAEESFEATAAFAWLREHAAGHGFAMSYPRGNPHGITYEPWHWCWRGGSHTG